MIRIAAIFWCCFAVGFAGIAAAQNTQTFVVRKGSNIPAAAKIQFGKEQQLMLQATKFVMQRDYQTAVGYYSQVLALNPRNIDAYLQRGIIKREMGDERSVVSDASSVVTLSNTQLQSNPRDADLYYQRGMGFRLLKNFVQAKKDMQAAISLGGKPSWQTDLRAIELEQKMAAQ